VSAPLAEQLTLLLRLPPDRIVAACRKIAYLEDYECAVVGDESQRLIVLAEGANAIFVAVAPLEAHPFIRRSDDIWLTTPSAGVSKGTWSLAARERATKPHVFLVGLYHAEHFPTVRFHLALGLLAASARATFCGRVTLRDMQLGATLSTLHAEIQRVRPEVIGISVTFGQADLLRELLDAVRAIPRYDPVIVVGGSLAVRNAEPILDADADVLVCTGSGETTIRDVVRHCVEGLPLDEIRGVAFRRGGKTVLSAAVHDGVEAPPELDLLGPTLDRYGVMLLETTRGCTHACSFCPRDHKGKWQAGPAQIVDIALHRIKPYYDERPTVARRLFLADEEFIGRDRNDGTSPATRAVADIIADHGFTFENSTRLDDVYDHRRSDVWNVERVAFWRYLARTSLNRMLFGLESGVDTVLHRFNKAITSSDVVRAIRIVTACGARVRLTYITFDPLMTLDELRRSFAFLGREDLLMERADDLTDEELLLATDDDAKVAELSLRMPVYREVPYMLVSMESLIGSRYLADVEAAGLAGDINLQLGRRDARYQDWRVGVLSRAAQEWIDRHFALDYTLKGLEKVHVRTVAALIREIRREMKLQAYELLGDMLTLAEATARDSARGINADRMFLRELVEKVLDRRAAGLAERLAAQMPDLLHALPTTESVLLRQVAEQCYAAEQWKVING
jgi:hypothetical protein